MSKVVLKIYGDIGENNMPEMFMGDGAHSVSAKDVADFLEANPNATEILVRINSRGGDIQEGWAIYDLLTTCGKKITTIGEGRVYSIATIVFLAGTVREMMANADGLIHNPYTPPYTLAGAYESGDLIKIAEGLQQEEEKILDFYARQTGTDKAKLATYMKDETKLSAEDMLALGFATKIVEPVRAYAYVKPKIHSNMTPAEEATFWGKVEARIASAMAALGLSRLPAEKSMELTDKDGKKLTCQRETGEPAVGDAASPDGTFTMADGKTIVVASGKITEIKPATTAAAADDIEALKAENARLTQALADASTAAEAIAAEKAELATLKAEAETEKTTLAAKTTEAATLVTELTGLRNQWKPAARQKNEPALVVAADAPFDETKVKEVLDKIKNQK